MHKKNKKPSQLRAYLALAWYAFRAQTRNPATFFFGFIFPVVFISIFGLIGNGDQKIELGLVSNSNQDNPVVSVLQKQSNFTLEKGSQQELEGKLTQEEIAVILSVIFTE